MRVKELSERSGVSVPTIKYYLREGLLPAGELVSKNQAHYDDAHLRRLRLIRALVDIGGLTIAAVRDVLAAADAPDETVREILYTAQESISGEPEMPRDEAWAEAWQASWPWNNGGRDRGTDPHRTTRSPRR